MKQYCPYCMTPVQPGQLCPACGQNPANYQASSHHFPPGKLLSDRYVVGKSLGEGGFGITYLGWDTRLERRVAVKEYFPSVFVQRESAISLSVTCYAGQKQEFYRKGREQFLQEARIMARFDKLPEIVHVLDFFPENNTAYIVMEFLEGGNLRAYLEQRGRIPAKQLFEMAEPLLQAVNAIHGAGIVHRDISPDNIMLLENGQIKLLDFGCARDVDKEHTMTVMLKHGYAPMEQYTGYNQGPWTDVYALCATFYHCLTETPPPHALNRIGIDPMKTPNSLGAALTSNQERALLKGLALGPNDRWQSVADLYAALYDTVNENPPRPPEKAETTRKTELVPPEKKIPEYAARRALSVFLTCVISVGKQHTAGLKRDGTVVAIGCNTRGQCNVDDWIDIVAIAAGNDYTVGLKKDGTVAAVGCNNNGQCNVGRWIDIAAIAAGNNHTVGLKKNGTVIAVGCNADGQCNVGGWANIVAVAAGDNYTVGLKKNGTVVAAGYNTSGQCNMNGWSNIAAISAGRWHTVGLKKNGTVVAVGDNYFRQCNVGGWADIVAIAAGDNHTVALKKDGTMVAVGNRSSGQCDVDGWRGIIGVFAGGWATVGLKRNNTAVATGDNYFGQCDVNDWRDIGSPSAAERQ